MNMEFRIEKAEPVHAQIERELLRQIQSGALKPGDRMPSAEDLARRLTVHPTTVQRALRRLKSSGLVVRTRRLGTFVKSRQSAMPIAVVFGPSLTDESSYFYRALAKSLQEAVRGVGWSCRAYDGFNDARTQAEGERSPVFAQLAADHRHDTFGGLISVGLSGRFLERIRAACGMPVTVRYGLGEDVDLDFADFTLSGVRFLAGRGCRRIVYLRTLQDEPGARADLQGLREGERDPGAPRVDVVQFGRRRPHYDEEPDRARCQALVEEWSRSGTWPDGIIMSDDIAARGLAHALLASGPRRLKRLTVLTWANEGIQLHYGIPVIRYVISPAEVARQLVAVLQNRMAGATQSGAPIRVRGRICQSARSRDEPDRERALAAEESARQPEETNNRQPA